MFVKFSSVGGNFVPRELETELADLNAAERLARLKAFFKPLSSRPTENDFDFRARPKDGLRSSTTTVPNSGHAAALSSSALEFAAVGQKYATTVGVPVEKAANAQLPQCPTLSLASDQSIEMTANARPPQRSALSLALDQSFRTIIRPPPAEYVKPCPVFRIFALYVGIIMSGLSPMMLSFMGHRSSICVDTMATCTFILPIIWFASYIFFAFKEVKLQIDFN